MEKNQDLPYDIEHSEADAIIEKMAGNEELVSELYDAYGKNFHELSSFWNELSAEEKIHAGWLRALGKKMKEKKAYFRPKRFSMEAIENLQVHLKQLIEKSKDSSALEMITALSNAVDLENSLLEGKFFEIFEGDSAEIKHTFESLRVNTQEHKSKVQRIWEQKRVRESTK